jgi:L-asparaginase II
MFSGILKTRQGHVEAQKPLEWGKIDLHGNIVGSHDFPTVSTYLRSTFKPLQSTALFHTIAQIAPELLLEIPTEAWVIASSSHSGEAVHQHWVQWWLNDAGLSREDAEHGLVCGVHPPLYGALELIQEVPSVLHHNCSGQHAMMLALAKRLNLPMSNYHLPEHPLFQDILSFMHLHTPVDATHLWGTDGCQLPTPYLSLEEALCFMHSYAQGSLGDMMLKWMKMHPHLVAGSHRFDTVLGQMPLPIISKGGAEGLVVLWNLETRETLIIKSLAGDPAARDAFAWHLLAHVGWIVPELAIHESPLLDSSPFSTVQSDLQFLF